MSLATGNLLGSYEIVGSLGSGGMGEVFRAWDPKLGREVAIKILPEACAGESGHLERFETECRALAALSHPHIVQIFGAGEQDGRPFLVMELVQGETLRRRMERGSIPWRKATEWAASIADGLAAAHAKGIIHRDLKPENVMLDPLGHVKILDFGLVKLRGERPADPDPRGETAPAPSLTQTGWVMGTARYMSPEQVAGKALDPRSDLFNLGLMLWEMADGAHPFPRPTPQETMAAILGEEPPPQGRFPPQLGSILVTCLEKDPSRRFQDAHDLAVALRSAAASPPDRRETWDPVTRRRRTRWGIRRSALAAAGLAAIAGGILALHLHLGSRGAPVAASPTVLALPTKVVGPPEAAFLADAVPSSLSTLLSGVQGLETKVPPTSLEAENRKGDLAQLAEAYHPDHLVITTITKKKDHLSLQVQVADTKTWRVRWGGRYEGTEATYQEVLREAAEAIARSLKGGGGPVQLPALEVDSGLELDLAEGRHHSLRFLASRRNAAFDLAVEAYRRALARSPQRADTMASIATLHGFRAFFQGESPEDGPQGRQAEAWALRALDLDPRCGAAWSVLADMEGLRRRKDVEKAVDFAVKGACFSPLDPRASLSVGATTSSPGSVGLLLAAARRSGELDPMDSWALGFEALGLAVLGRAGEGLALMDRAPSQASGQVSLHDQVRGYALLRLERLEEAERILVPQGRPITPEARFWIQAARGRQAEARSHADPLVAQWLGPGVRAADLAMAVVLNTPFLVRIGMHDEAFRLLERSVDRGVAPPLDWLLSDPDLQPLRGDRRFQVLLSGARRGATVVVRKLTEAKVRGELPGYLAIPLEQLEAQLGRAPERVSPGPARGLVSGSGTRRRD